ncbi:MAG TPA: glutathione peroxidase [Thermoplasmataceae archaeon]|nr:glutathione peroxidase [Thermoplasmataceae archaeon]
MRTALLAGSVFLSVLLAQNSEAQTTFHDFTVFDIDGDEFDLAQFKGKKVLVVNTASKCAFTSQYEELEKLYRKYGDENFAVIGFPSNDFAQEEPGTNDEIADFCRTNYDISFPMMSKIVVKGSNMHPLYKWLTDSSENGVEDSRVAWNFQKYMINEDGSLEGHVPPIKKPNCRKIISWIKGS